MEQTLQQITDAVSTQAVNLDALRVVVSGLGHGEGTGTGDGRGPGPAAQARRRSCPIGRSLQRDDDRALCRAARFSSASNWGDWRRQKNRGLCLQTRAAESCHAFRAWRRRKRRYLVWRKARSRQPTRACCKKRGRHHGRSFCSFFPSRSSCKMRTLEAERAKGKKLNEIRRTVFGVKGNGASVRVLRRGAGLPLIAC